MAIEAISSVTSAIETAAVSGTREPTSGDGNFAAWFEHQLGNLNEQILQADSQLQKLATGETDNLHHVMLSLEKAKLSFELTLQVRNKILEGYQEIMRMQI